MRQFVVFALFALLSSSMPDAFDVESTNAVKEDKLRDFLNSTLEPELGSIPMVGPATVKALDEAGIKNSVSVPCGRSPHYSTCLAPSLAFELTAPR